MDPTQMTDAEKQAIVQKAAEAGKTEGKVDAPKEDEVLATLNQTLKRNFTSRDEALKSLANLNAMVGDNAIAQLREKAKDADNFQTFVEAYAKESGKDFSAARTELLEELNGFKTSNPKTEAPTQRSESDPLAEQVKNLTMKLQEKELLEAYPEAKNVLKELKDLSKIHTDQELKQIYETTSLKDIAGKASTYEQEKTTKPNSTVQSSSRQVDFGEVKMKQLVEAVGKRGYEQDKVKLVQSYIEQMAK